jgi:hypothetical protein
MSLVAIPVKIDIAPSLVSTTPPGRSWTVRPPQRLKDGDFRFFDPTTGATVRVRLPVWKDDNHNAGGYFTLDRNGKRYSIDAWSPAAALGDKGKATALKLLQGGGIDPRNIEIVPTHRRALGGDGREYWLPVARKTRGDGVALYFAMQKAQIPTDGSAWMRQGDLPAFRQGFTEARRGEAFLKGYQIGQTVLGIVALIRVPSAGARQKGRGDFELQDAQGQVSMDPSTGKPLGEIRDSRGRLLNQEVDSKTKASGSPPKSTASKEPSPPPRGGEIERINVTPSQDLSRRNRLKGSVNLGSEEARVQVFNEYFRHVQPKESAGDFAKMGRRRIEDAVGQDLYKKEYAGQPDSFFTAVEFLFRGRLNNAVARDSRNLAGGSAAASDLARVRLSLRVTVVLDWAVQKLPQYRGWASRGISVSDPAYLAVKMGVGRLIKFPQASHAYAVQDVNSRVNPYTQRYDSVELLIQAKNGRLSSLGPDSKQPRNALNQPMREVIFPSDSVFRVFNDQVTPKGRRVITLIQVK